MKQISLCITTYNRSDLTINSFIEVMNDERINEIILVDDCSDYAIYNNLKEVCDLIPKISLHRNIVNLDCYKNKRVSVALAKNEYVIVLDSDNQIDKTFIDKIYEQEWHNDLIFAPDFAKPNFNYKAFDNLIVSKKNVSEYMDKPMFETMLNTMNYFVNRDKYLEVWDGSVNPVTSDSIFQNYNFLKSGGKIKVVEGLEYTHLVHDGSHYKNNVNRTPHDFHNNLTNLIKNLK